MEKIVTQSGRNGGVLQVGNPGNKGGGRPKDEIRALCASNLAKAAELIQKKLADDPDLTIEQAIKAADVSGKYSIGTKTETDVRMVDEHLLSHVAECVAELYGADNVQPFMMLLKSKSGVE